jgi:hypothetical protein
MPYQRECDHRTRVQVAIGARKVIGAHRQVSYRRPSATANDPADAEQSRQCTGTTALKDLVSHNSVPK